MRLRVEGDMEHPRVVNAETGEELEGVKEVSIHAGGYFKKCEITLSKASIDMAVRNVEASGIEGDKYAHMPLVDVAGLRWIKRRKP